jgi:hypothetical protein
VDVTGDGRRDYVVVAKTNASQRRFGTYVAQPSGRFSELVPTVDQQGSFIDDGTGRDRGTFVDVTGEGAADYLVVWRGASGQRNIATYVSRFDGTFNQYVNTLDTAGLYVADSTGRDLGEFADVNGDHRADYVVVWKGASGERNLATFCARADGTFAQYVNTLDTHGRFLPDSLGRDMGQFADVNHDGCADYVVVYPDGGNHRVFATFLSNCNGTFAQFVQTPDPNSQFIPDARGRDTGSFADVDGDGRTDYVVVYAGANNQRTFATYRASTTQNGFFQLPFVWTATSDQFNRDSLTGRDMGQFANVTAGDTRADYIVVHPDGNMNRLLTTYSAMADGHFNAGMTTTDRAGRFLGTATQGEYGMFGDIR